MCVCVRCSLRSARKTPCTDNINVPPQSQILPAIIGGGPPGAGWDNRVPPCSRSLRWASPWSPGTGVSITCSRDGLAPLPGEPGRCGTIGSNRRTTAQARSSNFPRPAASQKTLPQPRTSKSHGDRSLGAERRSIWITRGGSTVGPARHQAYIHHPPTNRGVRSRGPQSLQGGRSREGSWYQTSVQGDPRCIPSSQAFAVLVLPGPACPLGRAWYSCVLIVF